MFDDDDDDAEETKYLCDYVLDGVDKTNILFKHELVDETTKKPSPPEPLPTFLDILLPKYKNSENLAKIFFKKYQKLRRNKKMVKKARKKALQKLKMPRQNMYKLMTQRLLTMTMMLTLMIYLR